MKFKPMIVKPNRQELADTLGTPINSETRFAKGDDRHRADGNVSG